ncbi:MAG: ABC-2 family transporter protein [Clostridium sp.]|nr:ABC-2 family transporter protein [Clostridium sp.]
MKHIKHYLDVSLYHVKLAVLTMLEYPANFVGWLLSNPIQFILGFATIKFVVASFGTINGWDYGHLAFLYGIAVISHAFSMIFFVQGWFMGGYVVRGEFDRFMLRPLSVLFQFFFTRFNIIGITDLIPGICVFAYGCHKIQFHWTIEAVIAVILLITGATLIRGGIYIIMGTFSFWTKNMNDFAGFTQEFFDKTTMYPLSMYPRMMQIILTYVIPIGWISYYPAKDLLSGIGTGSVISLIIGIVTMTLAALFFKRGLRSYESAGQ